MGEANALWEAESSNELFGEDKGLLFMDFDKQVEMLQGLGFVSAYK